MTQQQQTGLKVLLITIVLVAIGFGLSRTSLREGEFWGIGDTSYSSYEPGKISMEREAGNFEKAVSYNASIQNNPNISAEDKATAANEVLGAQFQLTGDINARIVDIQNMKKIILDKTLSPRIRAWTLNILFVQFYFSGKDPVVFAETYKDEPFSSYLAPGDPDLSARHLAEWSYEMYPTSFSAISLARWYSEQYVFYPSLSANTKKEYTEKAASFLDKADQLVSQEIGQRTSSFLDSSNYIYYRYWRASVIGRLAIVKGEPYKSQYREEYEKFIEFAKNQPNVIARGYIFDARLLFAQRLIEDNDKITAKKQLDFLAEEMSGIENPDTSTFIKYLKNEYTYRPEGVAWNVVSSMFAVSSNFKSEVDKVISGLD